MSVLFISIFLVSCGKGSNTITPQPDPPPTPPSPVYSINSTTVSDITQTSATVTTTVGATNSGNIYSKGFYWSETSPIPGESDNFLDGGSGAGSMTKSISGLLANKPYYVRACYKKSSTDSWTWNSEVSFTTLPVPPKYSEGQVMPDGFTINIVYNNGNTAKGVKNVGGINGYGFGCIGTPTGATGTAIGTGITNTNTIASICPVSAAKLCLDAGGYLPSTDEMKELWDKRNVAGISAVFTTSEGSFWTSTEVDGTYAKAFDWGQGVSFTNWKQSGPGSAPPLTRAGVIAVKNYN